jgi:2'-5' RNA ligase
VRLFIAVNCDSETKSRLLAVRDRIKAQAKKGNFSRPENFHLTIVFLGETPEDHVPLISSIMIKAGQSLVSMPLTPPPFTLNFSHTGCFKHSNKELWWISADKDDAGLSVLTELRRRLTTGFEAAGIFFDNRPFNAHITLGREIKHSAPIILPKETITLPVNRISLMRSEHIKGTLVYTEIFGYNLGPYPAGPWPPGL